MTKPRRRSRKPVLTTPEEALLHQRRIEAAAARSAAMHRLLGQDGLAVQSAVALGLSALAPAGWPQLTPWQASFIARLGSRFLAAWVNGEAVKVQPEEGRDLAHLLEVLSLLARTQWAQIADCPRDIARHAITPEEARKLGIELPKVPRGIWHRTRL